jgi:hypothetical protein
VGDHRGRYHPGSVPFLARSAISRFVAAALLAAAPVGAKTWPGLPTAKAVTSSSTCVVDDAKIVTVSSVAVDVTPVTAKFATMDFGAKFSDEVPGRGPPGHRVR